MRRRRKKKRQGAQKERMRVVCAHATVRGVRCPCLWCGLRLRRVLAKTVWSLLCLAYYYPPSLLVNIIFLLVETRLRRPRLGLGRGQRVCTKRRCGLGLGTRLFISLHSFAQHLDLDARPPHPTRSMPRPAAALSKAVGRRPRRQAPDRPATRRHRQPPRPDGCLLRGRQLRLNARQRVLVPHRHQARAGENV